MRVLIACEYSGRVRLAFRARGHDAWSCDLLPAEDGGRHIQGDVLPLLHDGWELMIAHPPCTHLAVSGARWFAEKRASGEQQEAIDFFLALARAPIPRIAIENPVCIMSSVWREPDQVIQPWQFGHEVQKKTRLWLRRLPFLVPTQTVSPKQNCHEAGTWFMKGGKDRQKNRAKTFTGIAAAMAEQWGSLDGKDEGATMKYNCFAFKEHVSEHDKITPFCSILNPTDDNLPQCSKGKCSFFKTWEEFKRGKK